MSKPKKASKKATQKKETPWQVGERHNRELVAPDKEFERKMRELRSEFPPGTLSPENHARWLGRQMALEKAYSAIVKEILYDHDVPDSAR